jgi:hypothetical protein
VGLFQKFDKVQSELHLKQFYEHVGRIQTKFNDNWFYCIGLPVPLNTRFSQSKERYSWWFWQNKEKICSLSVKYWKTIANCILYIQDVFKYHWQTSRACRLLRDTLWERCRMCTICMSYRRKHGTIDNAFFSCSNEVSKRDWRSLT